MFDFLIKNILPRLDNENIIDIASKNVINLKKSLETHLETQIIN